jgi:hypothetical protein
MAQEIIQRLAIDFSSPAGPGLERLELGGHQERAVRHSVIEWLLAHAVARKHQFTRVRVPQREGEHADAARQRCLDTPGFDRREQYFGIGMPAPLPRRQLLAQFAEVVDLAVESDGVAPAGTCHRLRAAWRQIDDRQATVRQRHAHGGVRPDSAAIRAAMPYRGSHDGRMPAQFIRGKSRLECQNRNDAAHGDLASPDQTARSTRRRDPSAGALTGARMRIPRRALRPGSGPPSRPPRRRLP